MFNKKARNNYTLEFKGLIAPFKNYNTSPDIQTKFKALNAAVRE